MIRICKICGKEFKIRPAKIKIGKGKYCSNDCYYKSKIVDKITILCKACNKKFKVIPSQINRKYCSIKCSNLAMSGENHPMFGKHQSIETKQKISDANSGKKSFWYGKHHSVKTKEKMRNGSIGEKSYTYGKHLSKETKRKLSEALSGEKHWNWRGGKSFEPYTPSFNQQLKDRIRVRDNFICQLCGVPELECNERLSIHHVDYLKENCSDDNLISLCRPCNIKVNKNREYWEKHFKEKMEYVTHP